MIQQVAGATACSSRYAERITQAESIKLGSLVCILIVVCLIDYEDDTVGLLCTAQDGSHLLVQVGDTRLDIHEEQDDISLVSGQLHLLTYFLRFRWMSWKIFKSCPSMPRVASIMRMQTSLFSMLRIERITL